MQLRREVLERMARLFFRNQTSLPREFGAFLENSLLVEDYAEFRATCERTQKPWHVWPERLCHGKLQELHALLSLESHRHQTVLVGENLGTVPPEVNRAMGRHQIRQTYVLQYAQSSDPASPIVSPPRCSVAMLNTHDMPPFAARWRGRDILERADSGLLSKAQVRQELRRRKALNAALVNFLKRQRQLTTSDHDLQAVTTAALRWLACEPAETVLINLEDLWHEQRRQNAPGTPGPLNWRRKSRLSLEQIRQSSVIRKVLCQINRLRSRLYRSTKLQS